MHHHPSFSAIRALLKHAGHQVNAPASTAATGATSYARLLDLPHPHGGPTTNAATNGAAASQGANLAAENISVPRGVPLLPSDAHDLGRVAFDQLFLGQGIRGSPFPAQAAARGAVPLSELNAALRVAGQGSAAQFGQGSSALVLRSAAGSNGSSGGGGARRKHTRTGRNRFPRNFRLGGYGLGLCGAFLVEAFGNTNTAICLGEDGGSKSTDGSFRGDGATPSLSSSLFALFRSGNEASFGGGGGGGGGFAAAARAGSAAFYGYGGQQPADDDRNSNNSNNGVGAATPARGNSAPRPIPPPASPAARAAQAASLGLDRVFHDNKELGTQVTLGGIAGFCSGYAVKKVSKVAAFVVGVGFIGVQVARYYGVINDVDWSAVEEQLVRSLDTDGDGRITHNDLKAHFDRAMEVLGFNLPSGAAFATFFLMGLRYG